MGVNFHPQVLSNLSFFLTFLVINFIVFYLSFYLPLKRRWFRGGGIYDVTGVYQTCVPFFIQNFIIFRSFMMKKIQTELWMELRPKFTQKSDKSEKKFIFQVFCILIIRVLKIAIVDNFGAFLFNTQTLLPELIYSANDLMFCYYVNLSTEYFDFINRRILMMRSERDLRVI